MQAKARFVTCVVLGAAVLACSKDQSGSAPAPSGPPATAAKPAPAPMPPASASVPATADGSMSGSVLETMDAGGYTYAKLDRGADQVWVAGPVTKLAVGVRVTASGGMLMTGFRSTTLNRTFDQIYFVNALSATGATATAHAGLAAPAGPAIGEKIAPAANGQTVAQIFGNKDKLVGKPIVVRGKVVKFNGGILGHNWIHVQDGTGAAGTNDLTITTSTDAAVVAPGAIVVARGTLAINKDFGAGYSYPVLIENATLADK